MRRLSSILVVALAACSSGDGSGTTSGVRRAGEAPASSPSSVATVRAGDFVLENAHLRAVVQDRGPSPWLLETPAAHLVDLHRKLPGGVTPDILKVGVPFLQFRIEAPIAIGVARDAQGRDVVRVEAGTEPFGLLPDFVPVGRDVDVLLETDYRLGPDDRFVTVETRVTNRGRDLGENALLMDLGLFGGEREDFVPRLGDDVTDVRIDVPFLVTRTPDAAVAIVPERGTIPLAGSISGVQPIIYATDPLPAGGTATYRRFWVPGRDLSDVLEVAYGLAGVPTGSVEGRVERADGGAAAGARVRALVAGGETLVSEAYADDEGRYRLVAPTGRHRLEVRADGGAVAPDQPVDVTAGGVTDRSFTLPASATLRVTVRDTAGRALPAEVLVEGPVGERVGLADGRFERAVPPGRYTITAMRGPEYTQSRATVEVAPGAPGDVSLVLDRVVDTSGYLAADLHLHAIRSPDSGVPIADRVTSVVATGLEWVAATDHDVLTDYGPVIEALGLGSWLGAVVGQEVSTSYYGHFNAFPLVRDETAAAAGAVSWYFREPATLFEDVRRAEAEVLQVNHARMDPLGGYFEAIAFDPVLGVATRDPGALGLPPDASLPVDVFDAVEVFNDKTVESNEATFLDYMGLLDLGLTVGMTGNSDSHNLGRIAGFPRTYVRSSTDDPALADDAELFEAIASARLSVSGGLYLEAGVGRAGPGSVVSAPDGDVSLDVRLQGAPWVDADRVEVIVGGETVAVREVSPSTEVVRFDERVPVSAARDTWIIVRASGDDLMVPWKARAPYAVTNPIWVDVDGNGRFDAR